MNKFIVYLDFLQKDTDPALSPSMSQILFLNVIVEKKFYSYLIPFTIFDYCYIVMHFHFYQFFVAQASKIHFIGWQCCVRSTWIIRYTALLFTNRCDCALSRMGVGWFGLVRFVFFSCKCASENMLLPSSKSQRVDFETRFL